MLLRLEPLAHGDGQVEDPTRDSATAAKVFAELRGAEPVAALGELTQWIAEVDAGGERDEAARSAVLARVQEAGEPQVGALLAQLIGRANVDAKAREAGWRAIDLHLEALTRAMEASGRALLKEAAAKPVLQAAAAAGTARLLRACRRRLKSCLVRYRGAPPNLWRTAYAAHRAAEAVRCDGVSVHLHESHHAATTVTQELLRLLLFQAASPARMAPGQIEVADWMVEQLGTHFVLRPRGASDAIFCFDPASDVPPRPAGALKAAEATASRYFSPGAGHDALVHMGKELQMARRAHIKAFSQDIAPHWQLSAIRHLLAAWGAQEELPFVPRSAANGTLTAVHGFGQVWQQISRVQSVGAMALVDDDDEPQREPETWTLSEAGDDELCVDLPQGARDWARCGELVAVSSRAGVWNLALVRSLHAQEHGLRAELRVLGGEPEAIHVRAVIPKGEEQAFSNESARVFGFNHVRALMLGGSADAAHVILPSAHWQEDRVFQTADPPRYLRPVRALETGDDYVRAGFRWAKEP